MLAPHLRLVPGVDVAAATFISKVERLKLLKRSGRDAEEVIQSIAEDAATLPDFVVSDPQCKPHVQKCLPEALKDASPGELTELRDALAPQMKYKRRLDTFLELDLMDDISLRGYIVLTKSGTQMYVAEYRRLVEARILELVANHPTILAIQRGETIDDWQLLELERTLTRELGESDLEVTPDSLAKVFSPSTDSFLDLVRQVLDMEYLPDYKDLVARQFEAYVTQHNYNADQIRFLRAVQSVFLQKRHLEPADLYEPPLDRFGVDAVDRWFTENELKDVVDFANRLAV